MVLSAPAGCEVKVGGDCFSPPYEDLIFLSPSVKRGRDEISRMVDSGTRLSSDAEIFFALCDRPVLAVSGSDGKSTTVKMAEAILKARGIDALACGNLGIPFIDALDSRCEVFITEISSFTLEYLAPKTRRALITNISENHLDWHGSYRSYIRAKKNLLVSAEETILSPDDEVCKSLIDEYSPRGIFSVRYCYRELRERYPKTQAFFTSEGEYLAVNGEALLPLSALAKKEPHNIKNALAAMALTHGLFDTGRGFCALTDFVGLPHRIETVAQVCGVTYIDSSIDSSPERTKSTLLSLGHKVHILLGGRGKGLSYAPLVEPLLGKNGYIIISGENRWQIARELSLSAELLPRIMILERLEDAIKESVALARHGDTVLLSPASTSYDAYSSFEERGEKFKEYIKRYTEGIK